MADQPTQNTQRIASALNDLNPKGETPGSGQQPQQQRPPSNLPSQPATPPASRPTPPAQQAPAAPKPPTQPTPPGNRPPRPPVPLPPRPQAPAPAKPTAPEKPSPPAQQPVARPQQRPSTPSTPATPTKPSEPTTPTAPYTGQLRTMQKDIANLRVGKAPESIQRTAPSASPTPSPERTSISLPSVPASGAKKNRLLIVLVGVAVIGIVILGIVLFGGGDSSAPIPSATPTPTVTLTPPPSSSLETFFGRPGGSASLNNPGTATQDFLNSVLTAQPSPRLTIGLEAYQNGSLMTGSAFAKTVFSRLPTDLESALANPWIGLVFGQTEIFAQDGSTVTNASTENRLILVFELTDATQANQAMQSWESQGLASDLEQLFGYDLDRATTATLQSATYRGVPVRYQNYPFADHSLDWAITLASNGKNYLILSSSRQSLFFAIDQLMQ